MKFSISAFGSFRNLHRLAVFFSVTALLMGPLHAEEQTVPQSGSESEVTVITAIQNEGEETQTVTNRYVELANGLNYLDQGVWKRTETTLETEPGFAKAWKGPHKVAFSAELDSGGAVAIELPDGGRLRSQIYGLAYVNHRTGESVLIAGITNAQAWITEPNRVLYPDAFQGFAADVRYTYTRDGLEQDVILRESPPPPSDFGWSPADVHIEVWTEFDDTESAKSSRRSGRNRGKSAVASAANEEVVDLGTMEMTDGRAFQAGQEETTLATVTKRWETAGDGRSFLVEAVPMSAVAQQLDALPEPVAPEGAAAQKPRDIRKFPNRLQAFQSLPRPTRKQGKEQAQIPRIPSPQKLLAINSRPGVVLDYQLTLTGNQTNQVFKGDTTYYIAGNYTLSGTTTLEGGTVLKFAQFVSGSIDPRINVAGPLVSRTSLYRPAVFTAKDDDSVGEKISGSTGAPTTSPYANYALRLAGTTAGYKVEHVRFCFTSSAVSFVNTYSNTICNAQFVKCLKPIMNSSSGAVGAYNVLVDSVPTGGSVFNDDGVANPFFGENLTIHSSPNLRSTTSGTTLDLKNSLIVAVTNVQSYTGNNNQQLTSAIGVFQSALAGRFYLASQSSYRNAGATTINVTTLGELKQLTTFPPRILTANFGMATTLYPQALRDTDVPDLGYHYPPLDYVWTRLGISNATLTLTNGVAIGFYGPYGISLSSGASLVSGGLANRMNRLTTYQTVQEQPEIWITNTASFNVISGFPKLSTRFTDISLMSAGNGGRRLSTVDVHGEAVAIKDSSLRGVYWKFYNYSTSGYQVPSHSLLNSWFDRSEISWYQGSDSLDQPYYLTMIVRNCLLINTKIDLKRSTTYYGTWAVHDNVFSGVNPTVNFYTGYVVLDSVGNNGSVGTTSNPFGGSGNKPGLLSDFQTGPLGPWYYPSSGATNSLASLINADTARTPASVGIYHYATRSDLLKDGATATQLDIGFHFVSTDAYGNAIDSDGDSVADYLEDFNGNSTYGTGDLGDWSVSHNTGLGSAGAMEVFTPLN